MNYDGTSTPSSHAERVHGNLPKVLSWLEQMKVKKEATMKRKRSENDALKMVGIFCVAALIVFCIIFCRFCLRPIC